MRQKEYLRLKAKIEADYRQNLDALNRIWKMAEEKQTSSTPASAPDSILGELLGETGTLASEPKPPTYPATGLAQHVRAFIEKTTAPFTIIDVEHSVIPFIPGVRRVSIATALKRLHTAGKISIESQGSGRRPSVYKRAL